MLEVKDLYKVYKPKKGVPVVALNRISITFPDKGMVFLLGKSGSGKSTLLNLLGGLEKYDDGDITIKGVSSKNFKQQHFDSYRNTYVGFIFQEYNVLDEFSVGANIALAIELQGRKATDEEINRILEEVDLAGYGNRKPNELSGGQKQRVAIARALVKNPEIIMADEPTGALDSNTGKQILDTLKKLSKDKLVIVVSHDREFSEQYADRIIELADGNIISDVECVQESDNYEQDNITYSNDVIMVAKGYHLTSEDLKAINDYLDGIKGDKASIISGKNLGSKKRFENTRTDNIKREKTDAFKLIKSKLPMKSAVKIGASGLKYKKIRLVITIILSCISFGLFGLADTMGSYDHIKTCTQSLMDSNVNYLSLAKNIKISTDDYSYWAEGFNISKEEKEKIESDLDIKLKGVYVPKGNIDMSLESNYDTSTKFSDSETNIYTTSVSGFTELTEDDMESFGYSLLAGKVPEGGKNQAAISEYMFETFKKAGYTGDGINFRKIEKYEDMVGKTIKVNGNDYTITGIIDTGFDFSRYESLMDDKHLSNSERVVRYVLYNEWYNAAYSSISSTLMLGEGDVDKMIENAPDVFENIGTDIYSDTNMFFASYMGLYNENVKNINIKWLDGEKTALKDNEIIMGCEAIGTEDGTINYDAIKNDTFTINYDLYSKNKTGIKVVGIIESDDSVWNNTFICNENLMNTIGNNMSGDYNYIIGAMPKDTAKVRQVVEYSYGDEDADIRFVPQNAVTYELETVNEVFESLSKVFMYVGIGFALFAALMLSNFIGASIAHKKQEIGILRAIGSRSNDVFRIFFSESFIIAMINFVLSACGVGVLTAIINNILRKDYGILITVLNYGIRQIALLLLISIVVAFIASFIPVKKIASKKPIDAIKDR